MKYIFGLFLLSILVIATSCGENCSAGDPFCTRTAKAELPASPGKTVDSGQEVIFDA